MPKDMARDVIAHILKVLCSETGLFPVIIESDYLFFFLLEFLRSHI
jgi:hypothetical protein